MGSVALLYKASQHVCRSGYSFTVEGQRACLSVSGACSIASQSQLACLSVGVAVATVDKVGRRPLLLGGVAGLVLSLLALSGAQGLVKGDFATWVSVVGLLAYTASYQVGPFRHSHLVQRY